MVTAMMIALGTPAFADISDYESMHRRLADVLGSRAQADAAYDKLMQEANTYGQPIDSVVDLFIAVCTASGECNPYPFGIWVRLRQLRISSLMAKKAGSRSGIS